MRHENGPDSRVYWPFYGEPHVKLGRIIRKTTLLGAILASGAFAQDGADDPMALFRIGADETEAVRIHDQIYQATGFGNSFMVVTDAGNVIIDTSLAPFAPRHKKLLTAVSDAPVKYIILTHGHADHTGGVRLWRGPDTEVIAHADSVEFAHYHHRLEGFYARRNAAQFPALGARPIPESDTVENYGAAIDATILFEDAYAFELGGLTFELLHTPGETPDHLTVWIPELKAAFTGDNFYESFPNIYTLRGTKPRWALEYVESLEKVLELKPEMLIPSHGDAVHGNAAISDAVTRYRDAILYVHDATVKGMNEGKDVWTLMNEIALPEHLDIGEGYGTIAWSVRGIYEGYAGWFDGNPAGMYPAPASAAYPDVVALAGGADAVVERAEALLGRGRPCARFICSTWRWRPTRTIAARWS